jgi:hypothetical protein
VLERVAGTASYEEYAITEKGIELWPAVRCLTCWGNEFYAPAGPRRLFHHAACGTEVDARDVCPKCNVVVKVGDLVISPGPGLPKPSDLTDPVTSALQEPRRLLDPLNTKTARSIRHG